MKVKFLGIALLLISTLSSAQSDSSEIRQNFHRLGVMVSTANGVGFSFKYTVKDKDQFQLVALPIAVDSYNYFNVGGNYYRKFINTKNFDVLFYTGLNWSLRQDKYTDYFWNGDTYVEENGLQNDHNINGSLGFAFEAGPSEFFKFTFHLGYAAYDFIEDISTYPAVGVGLEFAIDGLLK